MHAYFLFCNGERERERGRREYCVQKRAMAKNDDLEANLCHTAWSFFTRYIIFVAKLLGGFLPVQYFRVTCVSVPAIALAIRFTYVCEYV
jgi:hypothetical protein